MRRMILSTMFLTLLSVVASGQTSVVASQSGLGPRKADPVAWNLLKETRSTRYYFVGSFDGFTSDIMLNDNGRIATGVINYEVGRGADLQLKPGYKEAEPWALETILNMIQHRRSPDFERGDGRHPITFAEDDNSPAGRRVALNDAMRSSYRIRDGRVTEVDRTASDEHFIISILEETPAGEGRYLPHYFTVTYFDARTGAVKRTETFTDEYKKIDRVWVPASRRILRAENGKVITRVIEFHNPRIRFNNAQSSQ
jgi:hypothetical protein